MGEVEELRAALRDAKAAVRLLQDMGCEVINERNALYFRVADLEAEAVAAKAEAAALRDALTAIAEATPWVANTVSGGMECWFCEAEFVHTADCAFRRAVEAAAGGKERPTYDEYRYENEATTVQYRERGRESSDDT